MIRRGPAAVVVAALALGVPTPGAGQAVDLRVASETRLFVAGPAFGDQEDARVSPSLAIEPALTAEWLGGDLRLTAEGFARIDAHDDERSHADVRALNLLWLGEGWTLLAGVGRVFWGVTEVRHLVDVVNQVDGVEDLDGEDRLGQPMVNLTLEGGWGALDLFYLPYFRERTFPGEDARLRGPLPVLGDPVYEAGAGRWHPDVAARWAGFLGPFDVGVSVFRGTSREPRLVPEERDDGLGLRPHYDVVDEEGLTIQLTRDATLWKVEAMTRGGHGDRFGAIVAGVEHTLYQVFPGHADLGLLAEVMLDGRDETRAPPTVYDRDVFVGARWALNDVDGTEILGGPVVDLRSGETLALVEASRRLGNAWEATLEGRFFMGTEKGAPAHGIRRDSFVTLRVSRYF